VASEATALLAQGAGEHLETSRRAVEAIEAAVRESSDRMSELLGKLGEALRATAGEVASAVGEEVRTASAGMQAELRTALDQAAQSAAEAIGPIAERATQRAGEVAQQQL